MTAAQTVTVTSTCPACHSPVVLYGTCAVGGGTAYTTSHRCPPVKGGGKR